MIKDPNTKRRSKVLATHRPRVRTVGKELSNGAGKEGQRVISGSRERLSVAVTSARDRSPNSDKGKLTAIKVKLRQSQ
jgi:hypothetical protein